MIYGGVLGVLMVVLGKAFPQPAGSIILWSVLSIQAAAGCWVVWKRLRLFWFNAGAVAALAVSVAMIFVSARGFNLATMVSAFPQWFVVAIWLGVLAVPLSVGLESWRDSHDWQARRAATAKSTVWDLLTFRHIPDLRSRSRPG